ncbi:UvrD-helicase domain-containing protein [uncultured Tissierella sp.]|uniref:UvrD-helicase domain-containing protein n=1 Tax=uncultured Tissierella sp. TaxID=448160 RepID=UPI002804521C|nr:UvrD-helicase domain-containing protein [uncultured Tissierella sp.]MDU5082831.1 UvrD-helicase domain-containing protein [Bacillota bacterium]
MNVLNWILNYFKSLLKNREQKKRELINKYRHILNSCNLANERFNTLFNGTYYINYQIKDRWKTQYNQLFIETEHNKNYKKAKLSNEEINKIIKFITNYSMFLEKCDEYNLEFVEKEKINFKDLFDNIEGRALDSQQRDCICKDEINNLVIAGAGSGKTTTIVGKVKYLLTRYKYKPNELLVLSFTNASAKEMRDRILKETDEDIDVMTFHKLGKEIIAEVEQEQRTLTKINIEDFVGEKFNHLTKKDLRYNDLLNKYFLSYMKPYKNQFDFKSRGEYYDYLRDSNIRTFKNEIVKSFEEMEIANFLYINRINYEYERRYEYKTANREYGQYQPDFYLTDYAIYLEHFGIDEDGNVPEFFQGKDGKSAKEIYNEGIIWKRQLHKEKGTKLVETYSWEKSEGVLLDNLKIKLEQFGVEFNPISRNELWDLIEKDKSYELTSFVKLMGTFINLLKSNNYFIQDIKKKNNRLSIGLERIRNEAFINLIVPIYEAYEAQLKNNNEIDFNDMINKAIKYVEEGKFRKIYKYIIVDEYQDISLTRYNLIKAIKNQSNSKLFCVGDDWQSIYRFAGSNIKLFTDFENYFGFTEKSYIETTYRFNKNLIDLSSKFILKNKAQVKKQLRAFNDNNKQAFELVYGENHTELSKLLKEKLFELPENTSVILLGRYNHKIDLKPYLDKELTFNNKNDAVRLRGREDLDIKFLTVHKSKGLQGDYVFILNNTNDKLGFPSQIEDDPVLNLLIDNSDIFKNAEERRLFYVALTRSKKYVYLMVKDKRKSSFVREIEKDYKIIQNEEKNKKPCPECKEGHLVLKAGVCYNGKNLPDFWACSNYPYCKQIKSIKKKEIY